ncbi:DUF2339 domain-containing protein [Stenotrophomonas sp. MMGLT7]|uniref:DUF2339 domain-containing protein n=1 Tax=Stenotrophomonas sp. MMGLT7 TaxID=2901227 RepID=UPI001E60EC6A|nr:DUF2339 domain-containing protein [Stenotrophomonas sp. MMGLT7]MCD7097588.1 DUF2339 domain-containing protein [Stenotrophomonas sp. MMGLT7]
MLEMMAVLAVLVVVSVPVLLVVMLVSLSGLRRRVSMLEAALRQMAQQVPAGPADAREPAARTAAVRAWSGGEDVSDEARAAPGAGASSPPTASSLPPSPAPAAAPEPPLRHAQEQAPRGPGPLDVALATLRRWFTEGNVPVKIGVLVLFAGVAALLKYASDQGWLSVPVELRLAGIAAFALAALVLGWRQRARRPAFALAVQGGAIGILLLIVFAAYRLYAMLPVGAAFALSVVLVAGLCVLAVLQDSRTLAVLGVLAGFLAPIWLSTGSGNHVALFSYYALLNAGVLAIAWVRPWRELNLLGFAFTFGIGIVWGVLQYRPQHFASTEPFLLLFFAFYLLIPILYALRQASGRAVVDGCLVFGTPLVAFSLQAALLEGERMPLALCALVLAAVYAALGWGLQRRLRQPLLAQSYAVLAVGFATLAVPLALSARATASVFALEGAALVWLGLRQQRRLPQWAGTVLQLAAAFGFLMGVDAWPLDRHMFANATFMSALLLALGGFASAWSCWRGRRPVPALAFYLWALGWWSAALVHELARFAPASLQADAWLALAALSGWLAAEAHRRQPAPALAATTFAGLALALPLAWLQAGMHAQPFAGHGAWAWLVYALFGVRGLWCLRTSTGAWARASQFVWWLAWAFALSLCLHWLATWSDLAQGWRLALPALPWLALAAVALSRWRWLSVPLGASFDACRVSLLATVFGVIGLGWLVALWLPAPARPLPWLPLLNPLELFQLAALALAARWLWSPQAPVDARRWRLSAVAGVGLLWITSATLRSVHHWGAVPWGAALWGSSLAQASLTVVWSVLGVIGWVLGSRRGHRGLWLAGAVLMAVVLAKLVLIDRQHLGNLLGIGSFIAYGLLCTVVGYLAPAPPRAAGERGVPA